MGFRSPSLSLWLQWLMLLGISLTLSVGVDGAKILFLHPVATKSETQLFHPFAQALADRGHELTVVTPVSSNSFTPSVKQIVPTTPLLSTDFIKTSVLEERAKIVSTHKARYLFEFDPQFMFDRCHEVLRHPEFQTLVQNSGPGSFDLIVMSATFQTCFDGLLYRTQAPFIMFASMPTQLWTTAMTTGFHPPTSFVPIPLMDNGDDMGFWDRLGNTVTTWFFTVLSYWVFNPTFDHIGRQYFGEDIPSSIDIERNVSMIFAHAHFGLTFPRPSLPDSIEIGGLHCQPAKKLPADLEKFVAGARDGVILFSLGSVVQANELPRDTMSKFLRVFSRLPQRVLWKYETEKMDNLPPNVKLSKWLPQQDILGHPNTKLFISHGGLLSTMESAYHGLPVLGLPIFVDQIINMNSIRKLGYSLTLEILDFTEEELEQKIQEMLTNPQYNLKAKENSARFRDQPQSPMERAIYWAEYVIRHKGAHHLRSAARKLNFWQYHSVDVVATLAAVFATIIWILFWSMQKLWRCIFGSRRKSAVHANRVNVNGSTSTPKSAMKNGSRKKYQ